MFIYKAMIALARSGGSVSFALPDKHVHAILTIIPKGVHNILLRAEVVNENRALEGDVHRALSLEDMKEFLCDERNETQVRYAVRKLWDRMEGR